MESPQSDSKLVRITEHLEAILSELGYDLTLPDLQDTPLRVAKTWMDELCLPFPATQDLFTAFPGNCDQMIVMKGHTSWSHCAHHLERIKYHVTIGYIPRDYILGLSKLARIADYYALGLTIQESYTNQICEGVYSSLKARGVGVYVRGEHHCMQARGVRTDAETITTSLKGLLLTNQGAHNEFLQHCR